MKITWTIKEIVDIIKERQGNEFDANLAFSGDRGNGKSTCAGKIFHRIPKFNPWKHQVYQREQIIKLLKNQMYGSCWDDEAINSSYKRNFNLSVQQELIKIITNYRDNFNVLGSAIPNFFSLDKDLRDLYFMHLHIVERGVAIIHMPLQGRLYSQDKWDAPYNKKVEEKWGKRIQKDPDFKPQYHKLSTFRGYLYFNDMTVKQKIVYKEVKKVRRAESFNKETGEIPLTFIEKIYKQLLEGKFTKEGLIHVCYFNGKKYSSVNTELNIMLMDKKIGKTVMQLVRSENKAIHNNLNASIKSLVPSV